MNRPLSILRRALGEEPDSFTARRRVVRNLRRFVRACEAGAGAGVAVLVCMALMAQVL